jgi:pimeloyl-ACP methyl ester carboxylesterase
VVTISMTDGYKLAADFIRRLKPTTTTPGLIFVHDAGANRRAWNPMMVQMAGRGYSVLSVDLRGHGENPSMQGNPPASCSDMTDAQWAGMLEDFHNVVSFMAMRHDVEAGQIAVVGYGLGATLALKAAAEPWGEAIRCVIAINPRVEDRGIRLDAGLKAIGRKRDVYIACPPAGTTAWAEAKAVAELLPAVKEFAEVPGTPPAPNSLNMGLYRSIPAWLIQSIPPVSNRPGRGGAVAPGAKGR